MTAEDSNVDDRNDELVRVVRGPVLVFTAIACIAFAGFVWGYARFGQSAIAQMERTLGVVQFEKGQRMEAAGEYANAAQWYRLALAGNFESSKYRTFTLKALGALLWWREGPEEALPYLEEAYAQPDAPITLYAPLCDSLLQVGRLDEIPPICQRWQADAKQQGDTEQEAMSLYYRGRVAQERGNRDQARALFQQGLELHRGGGNAYELGLMHYHAGEFDRALTYLQQFLESGAGGRAEYARKLRDEILQKQGNRPKDGT